MMKNKRVKIMPIAVLMLLVLAAVGCGKKYIPKPYGYMRIELPDTCYHALNVDTLPYNFDKSCHATALQAKADPGENNWINLTYPTLNATIHCSYKPLKNNLRELSEEARQFVYNHAIKAEAIPEKAYENPSQDVYGLYYELQGNTASSLQFVLTDSTQHFFRAALYFNSRPNQDSIAPVFEYIKDDVLRMIETFHWK